MIQASRGLARCLSSISSVTRFYKEAVVVPSQNGNFTIHLDKHLLRTPKKNAIELSSEALAHAVAQEWNAQEKVLKISSMHLTGLLFTAIDNPLQLKKKDIIANVVLYLEKDTILYRSDCEELSILQKENWNPVIEWVNQDYGLLVKPVYSLQEDVTVSEKGFCVLFERLMEYNLCQLFGFTYAAEALKSVLIVLATVSRYLDVEQAVALSLLEQIYQTKKWGKVEWAHDIEWEELRARLSAGALMIYLAGNETVAEEVS